VGCAAVDAAFGRPVGGLDVGVLIGSLPTPVTHTVYSFAVEYISGADRRRHPSTPDDYERPSLNRHWHPSITNDYKRLSLNRHWHPSIPEDCERRGVYTEVHHEAADVCYGEVRIAYINTQTW
jgi:hypothetical protein